MCVCVSFDEVTRRRSFFDFGLITYRRRLVQHQLLQIADHNLNLSQFAFGRSIARSQNGHKWLWFDIVAYTRIERIPLCAPNNDLWQCMKSNRRKWTSIHTSFEVKTSTAMTDERWRQSVMASAAAAAASNRFHCKRCGKIYSHNLLYMDADGKAIGVLLWSCDETVASTTMAVGAYLDEHNSIIFAHWLKITQCARQRVDGAMEYRLVEQLLLLQLRIDGRMVCVCSRRPVIGVPRTAFVQIRIPLAWN